MFSYKAESLDSIYLEMYPAFATHADLLQKDVVDVAEYIDRVMLILENEKVLFAKFLKTCLNIDHESEIKKLQLVWQSQMIERKAQFIENGFRQLLEEDCQKCLRRCFELLQHISAGDKIPEMFGKFISRQAILAMSTLSGDDQTDFHDFVTKLAEMRQHFCHMTVVSFKKDDALCKVLTKVFHELLHNAEDPSLARGPRLLAMYWDHSLRKENSLTEAAKELSESLKLCAASYGVAHYVEQHLKLLFHRLINDCCYHYSLETMLIKVLIAGLNADNESLMQRGLRAMQDISIKFRLNEMYQKHKDACCRTKHLVPTSLMLLQENLWTHVFVMHYESTCVLPAFCEKSIAHFEKFYATKFIKRRIKWMHHLSTAVVAVNLSGRSREVRVTLFGVAILFCFQKRDALDLKTIQGETMMKPFVLLEEVKLLIYHGILQTSSKKDLTIGSMLTLNKKFPEEKREIETKETQKSNFGALRKAQRLAECKQISRKRHMELHHPKENIPTLPGALASARSVVCTTKPAGKPVTCTHGSAPFVLKVSAPTPKIPKLAEQKPVAINIVKILAYKKKTKDIGKSPETVPSQAPRLVAGCVTGRQNDGRLFFEAISEMDEILKDSFNSSTSLFSESLPIHKAMMSSCNKVPAVLDDVKLSDVDMVLVESKEQVKNKEWDKTKVADQIKNNHSKNATKIPQVQDAILKVSQGAIAKTSHCADLKVTKEANIKCKEIPMKPLKNLTEEDLFIREWESLPLVVKNKNKSVKERVKRAVEEVVDIAEKHYLGKNHEPKPGFGSFGLLLDSILEIPDFTQEDNDLFKSYKDQLSKELVFTDEVFGLLDELFSDDEDKATKEERVNTERFTLHPEISDFTDEINPFPGVIQDPTLNTTALDDLPGHQQERSIRKRKIRHSLNRREKHNQNSPTTACGETHTSTVAPPTKTYQLQPANSQPTIVHDSEKPKTTTKSGKGEPFADIKTTLAEPYADTKTTQAEPCADTKATQAEPCADTKATQAKPCTDTKNIPRTEHCIESETNKTTQTGPHTESKATQVELCTATKLTQTEPRTATKFTQTDTCTHIKVAQADHCSESAPNNITKVENKPRMATIPRSSRMPLYKRKSRRSRIFECFFEISRDSELEERMEQLQLEEIARKASFPEKESDREACNPAVLTQDLGKPMTWDELDQLMASVFTEERQEVKAESEEIATEDAEGLTTDEAESSSEKSETEDAEENSVTAKMPVTASTSEPLAVQRVQLTPSPRRSLILRVSGDRNLFPSTDLSHQSVAAVDGSDPAEGKKTLDNSIFAEGLSVKESTTKMLELDSLMANCCIFKKCSPLSNRPEVRSSILEESSASRKDSTKGPSRDRTKITTLKKDPTPPKCSPSVKGFPSAKISPTVTTYSHTHISSLLESSPSKGVCNIKKGAKKSSTPQKKCSCMKTSCLSSSQASASSVVRPSSAVKTSAPVKSTSARGPAARGSTTEEGRLCQLCDETTCPAGRLRHRVQHPRIVEIKKWKN